MALTPRASTPASPIELDALLNPATFGRFMEAVQMVARSVAPRVALRKARWFLERLVKERPQRRKALIVKFCNRLQLDESGRSYCLSLLTADAVTPAQQARNAVYQEPRRLYQHHLETLPPPQLTGEELQALVSIEHAMV